MDMTPQQKRTTTESIVIYKQALQGKNFSPQTIRAYMGDLEQFMEWLKTRRVDWDIPYRIERINIVEFINFLAAQKHLRKPGNANLQQFEGF
jgi:site-specific recombinase XerD